MWVSYFCSGVRSRWWDKVMGSFRTLNDSKHVWPVAQRSNLDLYRWRRGHKVRVLSRKFSCSWDLCNGCWWCVDLGYYFGHCLSQTAWAHVILSSVINHLLFLGKWRRVGLNKCPHNENSKKELNLQKFDKNLLFCSCWGRGDGVFWCSSGEVAGEVSF